MDRETDDLAIDDLTFGPDGLIPAVVQQHDNGEVLMVAYMNRESLAKTLESRRTWFWSRSRQAYWMKGETSGNTQRVIDVRYDCDADTLLVLVDQTGPACHTGRRSCFYRSMLSPGSAVEAATGPVYSPNSKTDSQTDAPLRKDDAS